MSQNSPVVDEPNQLSQVIPGGSKVLWVASTGGHLEQLFRIAKTVDCHPDSTWITFDTDQSRSLLTGCNVETVDYVRPRDFRAALGAARSVAPKVRDGAFDFCVSTGAALASCILPLSRINGVQTIYIESVSRTAGPSLTGKLMRVLPGISTYTQHRGWSSNGWKFLGSLLEDWRAVHSDQRSGPLKIFVTLGTIKPYRFDRAVDAVLSVLRPDDQVVWQLGQTTRFGLPGEVNEEMPATRVTEVAEWADVVITHSGVGSILSLLDAGISPVLAIRDHNHGEHIDGHQGQIAREMTTRGLALTLDLTQPDRGTLYQAAATTIEVKSR